MTGRPSLRRALRSWREEFAGRETVRWPTVLPGPEFWPVRTLRACRQLDAQIGSRDSVVAPGEADLEALYRRVHAASRESDPLAALERRDRRRAPWVFFYRPPEADPGERWLGGQPDFVRRYASWMKDRKLPRPILCLLHEFLRQYPSDLGTFDAIRTTLSDLLPSGTRPSLKRALDRCIEFRFLDPDGDLEFVRRAVTREAWDGRSVAGVLRSAGLDTGLSHCGFLKSGVRKFLDHLSRSRPRSEHLKPGPIARLIALVEWDRRLRFDTLRLEIAEGLLRPFVGAQPARTTRKQIEGFLLRHYGHPHLLSGRAKWSRIPGELSNVFLRWLAENAMEAFFKVMRETALEYHWKYRERFWRAYFDSGLVAEAWFALGEKAARKLKRLPDQEGAARGSLRGAGSDQSVLLMRIRGLPGFTVAEWSHSGACRTWLDGNPNAPRLYRDEYRRHDPRRGHGLMAGSDFHLNHMGSENGHWQSRLAAWIEDQTGESVPSFRYLV